MNHNLKFDEDKIEKHINSITNFRDQMFQYTTSVGIKWRIFKTFICPYIELYLPLVVQHKKTHITALHKLQHHSMCRAVGVPVTAGRKNVERFLGERSVLEKSQRMADRIISALDIKPFQFERRMATRHKNIPSYSYSALSSNNKNFVVRLFMYKDLRVTSRRKVKFNSYKTIGWARKVNQAIKRKILSKTSS